MDQKYQGKLEKFVGNNALSRKFIEEMTLEYLVNEKADSSIADFQKYLNFSDNFFSKKGYTLGENKTYLKQ